MESNSLDVRISTAEPIEQPAITPAGEEVKVKVSSSPINSLGRSVSTNPDATKVNEAAKDKIRFGASKNSELPKDVRVMSSKNNDSVDVKGKHEEDPLQKALKMFKSVVELMEKMQELIKMARRLTPGLSEKMLD